MQPNPTHIVKSYDDNLADITRQLAELGAHVEAMLRDAMTALTASDKLLAQNVRERDNLANALEVSINEQAMRLIALRQPMAGDLRRIIGAVKIAGDLERIGDLASSLAKRSLLMDTDQALGMAGRTKSMGRQVMRQVARALDAFLNADLTSAQRIRISDDDIDALHDVLLAELVGEMTADPRKITAGAHLMFVAKHLERVGDHAVNIAEMTHFIETGQMPHKRPEVETAKLESGL